MTAAEEKRAKADTGSVERQLAMWVEGIPTHNNVRDECCPDFSCCTPSLLWPKEKRIRFAQAGEWERDLMLVGALGALLAAKGCNVDISPGLPDYEDRGAT